jgi:type II secretory pathway pseudopilin PulG
MRSGVTLAELVVVMALIGLLIALLVPAAGAVRRLATATACQGNLRQAGLAFLAYGADWKGHYPAERIPAGTPASRSPAWFDRLPDHLDQDERGRGAVLQCAGWRPRVATVMSAASPKSLKMNSYLDDEGRPRFYRQGREPHEAAVVLLVDAVAGETGMGQWGHALKSAVSDERHRGRINAVALDGHGLLQRPNRQSLYWLGREVP